MKEVVVNYFRQWLQAWDSFWFQPRDPATLCLIRILTGAMLVYTHLVWGLGLLTFFTEQGVFSESYRSQLHQSSPFVWTHFDWIQSPTILWAIHGASLLVLLAFTVGLWTRWTSVISFLIVVSYAHRAGGALFGLDQINGFLTLYLAISPCGQCYSLDSWRQHRRQKKDGNKRESHEQKSSLNRDSGWESGKPVLSTMANVGIRLIQVHLCVVYLFAGLGKLQGVTWWNGTAIWGALASHEYQTLDMTWMAHLPWLVNLVTISSVVWELSYAFLIWHPLFRPIFLIMAIMVHLGIGISMGMMTFGLIMLVANLAFVESRWVRPGMQRVLNRILPIDR